MSHYEKCLTQINSASAPNTKWTNTMFVQYCFEGDWCISMHNSLVKIHRSGHVWQALIALGTGRDLYWNEYKPSKSHNHRSKEYSSLVESYVSLDFNHGMGTLILARVSFYFWRTTSFWNEYMICPKAKVFVHIRYDLSGWQKSCPSDIVYLIDKLFDPETMVKFKKM